MIAIDSIVHREIAWALIRAITEIQTLVKEILSYTPKKEDESRLHELVEIHKSIEDLAEASYEDLATLAEKNTTLQRIFQLFVEEERKHSSMAKEIADKLKKSSNLSRRSSS